MRRLKECVRATSRRGCPSSGWIRAMTAWLAAALVTFQISPALAVDVTAARVSAEQGRTSFSLQLSEGVRAEVFTIAKPYRVIVDLPDVAFRLPNGTGSQGQGQIKAFRYGLFSDRQGRVVIDTTGPVKIVTAEMTHKGTSGAVELTLILEPTDEASFAARVAPQKAPASPDDEVVVETAPVKKPKARPVVVIDAGHGGIDPGATGPNNLSEKTLVLAVAQQIEAELKKKSAYDVKLTRTRDVFVPLDKRLQMSREFGADLFVSLHADSISEMAFAEAIRGATVYTLSERASDEQARLMAEKENASDLIAGLDGVDVPGKDQVKGILIDLMKRETANFSADFSNLLVTKLGKSIRLSKAPQRSAAFRVLKQTNAPSVLVELGYMSNSKDQGEMVTLAWQSKVAASIVAAIDNYFAKRTAVQP